MRWQGLPGKRTMVGALMATVAALALPAGANAAPNEVCFPEPKVATSFCMTADLGLSSLVAGAPFDLTASAVNTSTGADDADQDDWLAAATFAIGSTEIAVPTVTPSADLPNNLLIAGEASPSVLCSDTNDFVACPAGHGELIVNITDNFFLDDGVYSGSYGIDRIVNVVDGADPVGTAHWRAAIRGCVFTISFGDQCSSTAIEIVMPDPPLGEPLELPIGTRFSIGITGGGTADAALQSIEGLHINGQSSVLADGTPAGQTHTIMRLPSDCGTLDGNGEFIATDATAVAIERSLEVTGCTTTTVKARTPGNKVKIKGKVLPAVDGGPVTITLQRKQGQVFQDVKVKDVVTDAAGKYRGEFGQPNSRKCRAIAEFIGDATHAPSEATSPVFDCA